MRTASPSSLFMVLLVGCSASACRDPAPVEQPALKSSFNERLEAAIELHLRGVDGDDEAAEKALVALITLQDESPDETRVLAYLGSAKVLKAKRVFLPWEKGATCKEGLAMLDQAVAATPEDEETRFLRAVSTRPLPGFFGRAESAAADFAWLVRRAESALDKGSLTPLMVATVYLYHGDCLRSASDLKTARNAWLAAMQTAPDSEPARLASRRLESYSERRGG